MTTALSELPALAPHYGQSVWRQSRLKGREGLFWKATTRQEARKMLLAAKRYELTPLRPDHATVPLGHVAIEILELMVNLVDCQFALNRDPIFACKADPCLWLEEAPGE